MGMRLLAARLTAACGLGVLIALAGALAQGAYGAAAASGVWGAQAARAGIAWGLEVEDAEVTQPRVATADSAVAGSLPGYADYGNAYCVRVAGNIADTTAECRGDAPATQLVVEPGEPGWGVRPEGDAVTYAQARAQAAELGVPMCFWAGADSRGADYALYLPEGSSLDGIDDVRMVFGDVSDDVVSRLGRDDVFSFAFNGSGLLPDGARLYLSVGTMFSNGSYVDVYVPRADGALDLAYGSVLVARGYLQVPASGEMTTYVLVPSSEETAGSVSTDEWFAAIQQDPEGKSFPVVPVVVTAVAAVAAIALVLLLRRDVNARRTQRSDSMRGSSRPRGSADARGDAPRGKRGGLS